MNNLKERIEDAIETKAMKYALMGDESCSVTIKMTEEEKENIETILESFPCDWFWEIEQNEIHVNCTID